MTQVLKTGTRPQGTVVGEPASEQVVPPPTLEPTGWRPKTPREIQDGVEMVKLGSSFMKEEFCLLTGREFPLERDYNARWAAWRIIDAGGDPVAYVRFVCEQGKTRKPFWQQVFGKKAVDKWLPEYTRRQAEVAERATYETPPARKSEYAERMKQDQFPEAL